MYDIFELSQKILIKGKF